VHVKSLSAVMEQQEFSAALRASGNLHSANGRRTRGEPYAQARRVKGLGKWKNADKKGQLILMSALHSLL
jgi:hypothetical protein